MNFKFLLIAIAFLWEFKISISDFIQQMMSFAVNTVLAFVTPKTNLLFLFRAVKLILQFRLRNCILACCVLCA